MREQIIKEKQLQKETSAAHNARDEFGSYESGIAGNQPAFVFPPTKNNEILEGHGRALMLPNLYGESRPAKVFDIHQPGPASGPESPRRH